MLGHNSHNFHVVLACFGPRDPVDPANRLVDPRPGLGIDHGVVGHGWAGQAGHQQYGPTGGLGESKNHQQ